MKPTPTLPKPGNPYPTNTARFEAYEKGFRDASERSIMTDTPKGQVPEALRPIQRYKIGYHSDDWGQRSSTPSGIPDASGSWVRYADHVAALAVGQQEVAPVTRIPLATGGELCFEPYVIGSPQWLWALRRDKEFIRYLNSFEQEFVNAAVRATRPPPPAMDGGDAAHDHIRTLIAQHAGILEQNESAYFELCYHRATGWMAWITDKPLCMPPVLNPDRKVLAQGQGDTAEEACADAARAAQKEG